MMLTLGSPVLASVPTDDRVLWLPGRVIGRSISGQPRYDVKLDTGRTLNHLAPDQVRVASEVAA